MKFLSFFLFSALIMIQTQSGSSCGKKECKKISECPLWANMTDTQVKEKRPLCEKPNGYCCTVEVPTTPHPPPQPLSDEDKTKCGISLYKTKEKVAGGYPCKLAEYPWMAAIYYRDKNGNRKVYCGGALISKQWILTAAHCILENRILGVLDHVVLGDLDVDPKIQDGAHPVQMKIKNSFIHPNYSTRTFKNLNDIGLLHLEKPVNLNTHVRPICLDNSTQEGRYRDTQGVYVAGWGVKKNDETTTKLMGVDLRVKSQEDCKNKYHKDIEDNALKIDETVLCAYGYGKDSCQGDSGGPLMFYDSNEKWSIIGIVSRGPKDMCGTSLRPGIYTKVSEYTSWITEITKEYDEL